MVSCFTRSELGKDQSTRIRVETMEILRLLYSATPWSVTILEVSIARNTVNV